MENVTLNNIPLATETIESSYAKAVSRRHIPFSDKTILRDMGLKERTIRLRCYFWEETYEAHKQLVKLLWDETEFELNHPEHGLLKGKVDRISVREDDRLQTAEVDLDFIVGDSRIQTVAGTDIQGESESLYISGIKEVETRYRENLITESMLPVEAIDLELDPELPTILEQMPTTLAPDARAYVKKLDQMLAAFNGATAGITSPADSLLRDVDLVAGTPGRVIGTMASTIEKFTVKYQSMRSAPDRYLSSIASAMARFRSATGIGLVPASYLEPESEAVYLPDNHNEEAFLSVCAITASADLGKIYGEDEELRNQRLQAESVQPFDDLGRYRGRESVGQPMNVRQIEASLNTVRELSDAAVGSSRSVSSVKLLSDKLLDHVVRVKLNREKVIGIEVDNQTPLHLVCLKYGLPYNAAERIMLINRIRHPNFVHGGIDIYEN